jgi:excisionase family DNA binding protein
MPKPLTSLLTVQQAANQLQLSHWTVRDAIWRGELTATRLAGAIRIAQSDLDDYVAKGRGIRIKHHRHKETPV